MAIRRYIKKPSIPSLSDWPEKLIPVMKEVKESLEIITGRKGEKLSQLAGTVSVSTLAERVNEIIRVLQDGSDTQVSVGSDVIAPGAPAAPSVTVADLSAEVLALLGTVVEERWDLILNGNFDLCQRYYTSAATSSGDGGRAYGPDNWAVMTQDAGMPVNITWRDGSASGYPNDGSDGGPLRSYVRVTRSTGSLSNNQIRLVSPVEGYLYRPWRQSDIVLSFQVRSTTTGTYAVIAKIPKPGSGNYYLCPVTYTINAADTWETKEITIPAPPAIGTIGLNADNIQRNVGIRFDWIIRGGGGSSRTPGTWIDSAAYQTDTVSGHAAGLATFSDSFDLADVHTTGRRRSFEQTVALARRYYQRSNLGSLVSVSYSDYDALGEGTYRVGGNNSGAAGTTSATVQLSPDMNRAPTVVIYSPGTSTANRVKRISDGAVVAATAGAGRQQFMVELSMTGFTDQRFEFCWAADAALI